ncbi:class I SAM-dependent methyltransferase [Pseudoneobacillus sp. C159]
MKKVVPIVTNTYLEFLSKFGVGGAHPGGFALTKEILEQEGINETSRILDVGCGTGQTAAYLAARFGAKVTAMDINPIMIEKAKSRMQKHQLPVEVIQGSIEQCSLKSEQYDYIISESVLSFVQKPKAVREIFRLLKNGGRFIANELTINHRLPQANETEIKQFYGLDSLLMDRDWVVLLKQAGFPDNKIHMHHENTSMPITIPEFEYSQDIEPELYTIMGHHFHIMMKYHGILSYRIFSSTK